MEFNEYDYTEVNGRKCLSYDSVYRALHELLEKFDTGYYSVLSGANAIACIVSPEEIYIKDFEMYDSIKAITDGMEFIINKDKIYTETDTYECWTYNAVYNEIDHLLGECIIDFDGEHKANAFASVCGTENGAITNTILKPYNIYDFLESIKNEMEKGTRQFDIDVKLGIRLENGEYNDGIDEELPFN